MKIMAFGIGILTAFITMNAVAEIMTEEQEKAYEQQKKQRKKEAFVKAPDVIASYANSIGCIFNLNPENIVEFPEGGNKLFAVFSIDVGCSGGSNMSRPVFVELELSIASMQYYINFEHSGPSQTPMSIPQTVEKIYVKDEKLWYSALEHDWNKDGICCPSVPVTAELKFENGMWIGVPVDLPGNKKTRN